jgi:hypothetical protein
LFPVDKRQESKYFLISKYQKKVSENL